MRPRHSLVSTRLFSALLFTLVACAGTSTPGAPPTTIPEPVPGDSALVVSLERTACFGFCPMYLVEVYRDGTVKYRGDRFVKTVGEATSKVDAATLARIDQAIAQAGWDGFATAYDRQDVTDHPGAIVIVEKDGQRQQVSHYHGDHSAPKALAELEDEIDRLLNIEQFIGTPAEREAARNQTRPEAAPAQQK